MWRHNLDPEGKNEISEAKFFKFLRENKIITEKKQIDEIYKQCIFAKKGEEVSVGATVQF
jgi:phage antirepressor YoqD-like protein